LVVAETPHAHGIGAYAIRKGVDCDCKLVLGKLDEFGISYNYFIENAVNNEDYHMHIKIAPRPNIWAGLELGTGIIINPIEPEYAARLYRGEVKIEEDPKF
jgi:galactose-1-phosphate uridylyltransferase